MLIREPKVYLFSKSTPSSIDLENFLNDMKEGLRHQGLFSSETPIEVSARLCYLSFATDLNANLSRIRTDSKEYMYNILKSGHGSVLEHASGTFIFTNVSRVFTHELVRHRAGTAFSQTSMRFVRIDEIKCVLPKINSSKREEIESVFQDTISCIESAIKKLNEIVNIDSLSFEEKKFYTSLFRRLAPEGIATNISFTANLRALRHIIELRTSPTAEIEMRKVFREVFLISWFTWPHVFQDFKIKFDGEDKLHSIENLVTFKGNSIAYSNLCKNQEFSCIPEFSKV